MAHFLEHLVFKGGEKFDDYRKVNETAERMGGSLNAYTSHDLVAFHITVRAESAMEAIDLLTDFSGRPKIDADELDRERGVVIQEIARYHDQPSAVAEELIDKAAFGDHPLGRTVLGPEEHLRTFTRDAIVAFRSRRWAGARGGAFIVGNLDHVPGNGAVNELFERFPDLPAPDAAEPAPADITPEVMVEQRDTNQSAPADDVQPGHRPADAEPARGDDDLHDAPRRLDGLAPVRRDPRAAWPLLLVWAPSTPFADLPVLGLGSGLESGQRGDGLPPACARSSPSCATTGPTEEEVERARAYAAGRRVLAFENTNAVARYAANQTIVFGDHVDTDAAIARLDAVTHDQVRAVAADVADRLAIAVVGPHEAAEFAS
jgi:predicted Zn-dependent peptidase